MKTFIFIMQMVSALLMSIFYIKAFVTWKKREGDFANYMELYYKGNKYYIIGIIFFVIETVCAVVYAAL